MLNEKEEKQSSEVVDKIHAELQNMGPQFHAVVLKKLKDAGRERLFKESAIRKQESEQIENFIKENLQ